MYAAASDISDTERRKAFAEFARKQESKQRIDAMVALAATEAAVRISPDALDANPWLFNVENGTIDLRTGRLRPHDRRDLITGLARLRTTGGHVTRRGAG